MNNPHNKVVRSQQNAIVQKRTELPPALQRLSCDRCIRKKIKCDGEKPCCGSCMKNNDLRNCRYSERKRRGRPRSRWDNQLEIMAVTSGVSRAHSAYLDHYCRRFGMVYDPQYYGACLGRLRQQGVEGLDRTDQLVALPASERAVAATLLSSVALGARLMGNQQELWKLMQQLQAITLNRQVFSAGSESVDSLMHIAFLHDSIGCDDIKSILLEQIQLNQSHNDTKTNVRAKLFSLFAGNRQGCRRQVNPSAPYFTRDEVEEVSALLQLPTRLRPHFRQLLALASCGGGGGGQRLLLAPAGAGPGGGAGGPGGVQAGQELHSAISETLLSFEGRMKGAGHGALSIHTLHYTSLLILAELLALGRVLEGLARARALVDQCVADEGGNAPLLVMFRFWQLLDILGYLFWTMGDEEYYEKLREYRNRVLLPQRPSEKPFLEMPEMSWRGHCDHGLCAAMLPRLNTALRYFAPHLLHNDDGPGPGSGGGGGGGGPTAAAAPPPTSHAPPRGGGGRRAHGGWGEEPETEVGAGTGLLTRDGSGSSAGGGGGGAADEGAAAGGWRASPSIMDIEVTEAEEALSEWLSSGPDDLDLLPDFPLEELPPGLSGPELPPALPGPEGQQGIGWLHPGVPQIPMVSLEGTELPPGFPLAIGSRPAPAPGPLLLQHQRAYPAAMAPSSGAARGEAPPTAEEDHLEELLDLAQALADSEPQAAAVAAEEEERGGAAAAALPRVAMPPLVERPFAVGSASSGAEGGFPDLSSCVP